MLTCDICHKTYKNATMYNTHLSRQLHYINQMKHEVIYRKAKGTDEYEEWIKIRDACNKKRDETK